MNIYQFFARSPSSSAAPSPWENPPGEICEAIYGHISNSEDFLALARTSRHWCQQALTPPVWRRQLARRGLHLAPGQTLSDLRQTVARIEANLGDGTGLLVPSTCAEEADFNVAKPSFEYGELIPALGNAFNKAKAKYSANGAWLIAKEQHSVVAWDLRHDAPVKYVLFDLAKLSLDEGRFSGVLDFDIAGIEGSAIAVLHRAYKDHVMRFTNGRWETTLLDCTPWRHYSHYAQLALAPTGRWAILDRGLGMRYAPGEDEEPGVQVLDLRPSEPRRIRLHTSSVEGAALKINLKFSRDGSRVYFTQLDEYDFAVKGRFVLDFDSNAVSPYNSVSESIRQLARYLGASIGCSVQ